MKVGRENDLERLQHMLDAARKALSFAEGQTYEALTQDELRVLALARLLEIVGEAASKVTPEFRTENTQIPWTQMIGMRNHLTHGYFEVDLSIVWDTLTNNLPVLVRDLETLISRLQADDE